MKKHIYILWLSIITVFTVGCSEDEGLQEVTIAPPSNVEAKVTLSQDNSGNVEVLPSAENANTFFMDYGDGSPVSDTLSSGEMFSHIYSEGNFDLTIVALNVSGQITELIKPVEISFLPPENLEVTVEKDANNPFLVRVTASADLANGFEVTFGEEESEEPMPFEIGETVEYTYTTVGEFTVEVTALSGGTATVSVSEIVVVTDPLVLPIDFESETVDYTFSNFGGGEGAGAPIIDNPDPNEINTSAKVASYAKVEGSQTFAGTAVALNEPIDFSGTSSIAIDVFSPQAGLPVLLKVENGSDATIFSEVQESTSVSGEWETLTFTFPNLDPDETYSTLVLFFDFNTSGNGETYLFDNIELADPFILELPIDFEAGADFYNFTEFGGAPTAVIENPDPTGINLSANVAKTLKANGAATFAGSFIDLANPIDLSTNSTLRLKVWSPIVDSEVRLKLESLESDAEIEVGQVVQTSEEWVVLEFDFSAADLGENYSRIIFFFDFNKTGTGLEFYFDDLEYAN
jgi:hypothetical protein